MLVELLSYLYLAAGIIVLVLDLTYFQPWRSKASRRTGIAFWIVLLTLSGIDTVTRPIDRADLVSVILAAFGSVAMVTVAVLMTSQAFRETRERRTRLADAVAEADDQAAAPEPAPRTR